MIPESLVDEISFYLAGFKGRLATYNPSEQNLRSAVISTLQERYPETWHICDEEGKFIGKEKRKSNAGYSPLTCLLQGDGKILRLISNEGNRKEERYGTMEEYSSVSNRFIGLHAHSITFQLEDNKYFKSLQKFTSNSKIAKNNPLFVGGVNDYDPLTGLGIFSALEFYNKLLSYNQKTGILSIANYIMNEALHAELVSIFYQMNQECDSCDLSPLELNMIFSPTQQLCFIKLLEDIRDKSKTAALDQGAEALKYFKIYCNMLKECLNVIQSAKIAALKHIEVKNLEDEQNLNEQKQLCLSIGQKAWNAIEVQDDITFDLGKNWPLSSQQYIYIITILRTLPNDLEELGRLYRYLSSLYQQDNIKGDLKEQYRLNIICSVIQWTVQEKFYPNQKAMRKIPS